MGSLWNTFTSTRRRNGKVRKEEMKRLRAVHSPWQLTEPRKRPGLLAPRGQTVPTTLQCLTGGWGPRSIHQRTHLHSTSEQAGSISNTLPEEKRSPQRTLLPQKSYGVGESAVALPGKADPERASKTKYPMGCHINATEAHPGSHPVQPQIGTPQLLMRIQHTLFPRTDRQKVLVVP